MATIADWLKIDGDHVTETLHEACQKLSDADGELVLDFSNVHRIDAEALVAMEDLASRAKERAVKLVLRGVNVGIYKVLKLSRLADKLAFLT
jgi:anti-anti-sigma regulatory factor